MTAQSFPFGVQGDVVGLQGCRVAAGSVGCRERSFGRRQVLARTKAAYDTLGNNFKVLTYFDRVSSLAEPILISCCGSFRKSGTLI